MTAQTRPSDELQSAEQLRTLGHQAVEIAADYLAAVRADSVVRRLPPSARQAWGGSVLPEHPVAADELLATVRDTVLPYPMGNGHPRFFGWVNSAPDPLGIIGELLAAVQNPSADVGDIAALRLEEVVLGWLHDFVGFSPDAAGVLVGGGSTATLTCLCAARQRAAEQDGWDVRRDGVATDPARRPLIYGAASTHSSVRKAVELMGLGRSALRLVDLDSRFRLDVDALVAAIEEDRAAGRRPTCVVATAGSTDTGAIDPLDRIADVCAQHGLWLHIDGAYGAPARIHPARADALAGLARADSVTLDPHKWLAVPIECGAALVKDAALLRRTFTYVPPYLHTEEGVGIGGPDFAQYGFAQTRSFRALKVWLVLAGLGRQGLTDLVGRHLELAALLAEQVAAAPDLELLAPVELSVVAFRYRPAGRDLPPEQLDALNRTIEARVQDDGRAFLTSTRLAGRLALRACVLHRESKPPDVHALLAVVQEIGAAALVDFPTRPAVQSG